MEKMICKMLSPIEILGVFVQNGGTPNTAIAFRLLV